MTKLVPPDEIEAIVGVERNPVFHYARAVSVKQVVYILHSVECRDSRADLRDCPFSQALDLGIIEDDWWAQDGLDHPIVVAVNYRTGRLEPINHRRTQRLV